MAGLEAEEHRAAAQAAQAKMGVYFIRNDSLYRG